MNLIFLLQFPVRSRNQIDSDGNLVSELLDKLMVLSFEHLEACQNAGRLDEVCHQMVLHQHIFHFISFVVDALIFEGSVFHVFEILF